MTAVAASEQKRIRFRLMRPVDAVALQHLRQRAIRECAHHFGTPPDVERSRSPQYYRRQILEGRQRGNKSFVGGWMEEHLRAMAGIRLGADAQGAYCLITSMFVEPEWRGIGAGNALLRQSMRQAKALWSIRRFQINVEVTNQTALDLYLDHGFRILSRQNHAFFILGVAHDVFLLETQG